MYKLDLKRKKKTRRYNNSLFTSFVGGQFLFRSKITSSGSLSCLLRPELTSTGIQSSLLRPDVTTKHFTLTPTPSGALDYFRARRGPFTPGM
jgi:hypothetical protein